MNNMLSALIILSFFGIGLLAVIMYLDSITQVVEAKYFSFLDGSADASGNGQADHQEDKDAGTVNAVASVSGAGTAQATAKLGHEFHYRGKKPKQGMIEVKLSYRANVKVAGEGGQANIYLRVEPEKNKTHIIEFEQTSPGEQRKPTSDKYLSVVRNFRISEILPDSKFQVYVEAHAECPAGGSAQRSAQIEARVEMIKFRPKATY